MRRKQQSPPNWALDAQRQRAVNTSGIDRRARHTALSLTGRNDSRGNGIAPG